MRFRKLNELDKRWENFSDSYLVCDNGHLYSVKPDGTLYRLKSGYYRAGKKYPYQQVRGQFGTDKKHTVKIHRAVALAFIPNPNGYSDVDHINGDKTDNRAENLRWVSHQENLRNRILGNLINIGGISKNISDWARHYGVSPALAHARIRNGWNIEDAVSRPARKKARHKVGMGIMLILYSAFLTAVILSPLWAEL